MCSCCCSSQLHWRSLLRGMDEQFHFWRAAESCSGISKFRQIEWKLSEWIWKGHVFLVYWKRDGVYLWSKTICKRHNYWCAIDHQGLVRVFRKCCCCVMFFCVFQIGASANSIFIMADQIKMIAGNGAWLELLVKQPVADLLIPTSTYDAPFPDNDFS